MAGHVIEIRNGIRVQSANKNKLTNNENGNVFVKNGKFQDTVYQPNSYLHHHLHTLNNEIIKPNDVTYNEPVSRKVDVYNHLLIDRKSPTDSLCSNDSLSSPNSETSDQKLLRSSLKGSSMKFSALGRKVTFSDSVEFNDGDIKPVFTPATVRVPFYQRVENSSNGLLKNQTTVNPSPSFTNTEPITTENLLDQLRQDALLPKYPSNEDFSYPDSVVISQPSNVAIVSPLSVSSSHNQKSNILSLYPKTTETEILTDSLTDDSIELSIPELKTRVESSTVSSASHLTKSPPIVYSTPKKVEMLKNNIPPVTYIPNNNSYEVDPKHEINKINTFAGSNEHSNLIPQTPSIPNKKNYFNKFVNEDDLKPYERKSSSSTDIIHSDTVKSYLSDLVKSDSLKMEDSLESNAKTSSNANKIATAETDELYKSIEASLAGVTFENVNKEDDSVALRPKNDSHSEVGFISKKLEFQLAPTNSECISNAVKDGTSIPVRVHSGNVRPGRIIVSANKKKRRTISNFSPHPPPSPSHQQQQQQQSLKQEGSKSPTTEMSKHIRSQSLTNYRKAIPPKSYPTPKNPSQNDKIHSKRNSFDSVGNKVKVYSPKNKSVTDKYSPRTKVQNNNQLYFSNSNSPKSNVNGTNYNPILNSNNNNMNINDNNNDIAFYNDTSSPQQLSHHQVSRKDYQQTIQQQQHFSNKPSGIASNKTPTDDEINKLWSNVRDCLSSEVPEQCYSDTAFIAPKKTHHQRTFSGSLVRRVNHDRIVHPSSNDSRMYTSNNRYGSHEILYRPNSSDSGFSGSLFTKRHALLPQRTNRVLSPKIVTDFNVNGYNHNNNNINNNTYFTRKRNGTTGASTKKKPSEGIYIIYIDNLNALPLSKYQIISSK